QAEGTDASGGLSLKAVALFDTPAAASQRTAPVENLVLRGEMTYESASYRFSSLFEGQDTEIEPAGRAQLDKIIEEWRGVSHLRLTAIGHTDNRLASGGRTDGANSDALSKARAQAVANYFETELEIDPTRVTSEGRGSAEPLVQSGA